MKWYKSLTAATIAVMTLAPLSSGAQSLPNMPGEVLSSPGSSGNPLPMVPQAPASYVGLSYQILPLGLQDLGGWIVGEPQGGRLYAISRVQQEQKQMLWLELIVPPDSQGRPTYKVLDVINLPSIQSSEELAGSAGLQCLQNGARDPELIAIAKYDDANYWRQIKRAWRANRNAGKFQEIGTSNIVCDNRPGV